MASRVRIAVITDAHANLPALDAALAAIARAGCDAVGIGPVGMLLANSADLPGARFRGVDPHCHAEYIRRSDSV